MVYLVPGTHFYSRFFFSCSHRMKTSKTLPPGNKNIKIRPINIPGIYSYYTAVRTTASVLY